MFLSLTKIVSEFILILKLSTISPTEWIIEMCALF